MSTPDSRPWLVRSRILISRVIFIILATLVLFSHHSWDERNPIDLLMEISGFMLVMVGTLIRLYAAVYVYGRKTVSLIQSGPYSVVRNPLYVGSLVAGIGLGLESENVIALALIVFFFVIYYPFVIVNEERRLAELHGNDFLNYCLRVPRFIPNFFIFSEPETLEVNARKLKWAFLDSFAFMAGALLLAIVEALQVANLVPVLITVP